MQEELRSQEQNQDVNAQHLVWMVWARRSIRFLRDMFLLGLVLWTVVDFLAMQLLFEPYSLWWGWFNDAAPVGLAVFGGLLVATLLIMFGLRHTGPAGRLAADLVPELGRGKAPEATSGQEHAGALLRLLSRKRLVGIPKIIVFVFVLAVVYGTGIGVVHSVQAILGIGGHEIVIGGNASIGSVDEGHGRYDTDTYFLNTPYGEATAEGTPERGDHYVVFDNDGFGNVRAYPTGGLTFLLVGGIALVALAGAVAMVVHGVSRFKGEMRRRRSQVRGPLGQSISALSRGNGLTLRTVPAKGEQASQEQQNGSASHSDPADAESTSGARQPAVSFRVFSPDTGTRTGEQLVRRGRMITAGVYVCAAVVGVGSATLVTAEALEVEMRTITLDYLEPTTWRTEVVANYEDDKDERDLLASVLDTGGTTASKIDKVWRVSFNTDYSLESYHSGDVTIATVQNVDQGKVVSKVMAALVDDSLAEDAPPPEPRGKLAPGWQGARVRTTLDPVEYAVTYADGVLITVEVSRLSEGKLTMTEALREITSVISERGVAEFVADTKPPEYF